MDTIVEAFRLFTPTVLIFLFVGAMAMQVVGMIPGLGGPFLVALMLPFTYGLDPMAGIALLIGAASTSGTGNAITTILFGVPGSSNGIATLFDGPAMARNGEASRAIGAAMTSSFVGGVIGALFLALLIPLIRPVIVSIGPAEFTMLIAFAMIFLASVEKRDTVRALVSGMAGVALSYVGQEGGTGTLRYTFGLLYLWDGIKIVPAIIGLFAIADMLDLLRQGRASLADNAGTPDGFKGLLRGILDTFRYWKITLQSSLVGVLVGVVPGVGGAAGGLMAYAQAARIAKDKEAFGKGSIEGVLAAEAANNSKEGGALVPTLALGIPGGAEAAILLVGLITLGVQPGRQLITENVHIIWWLVALLVIANFFATAMTLAIGPWMARVTFVPLAYVIAPVSIIGLFGAFNSTFAVGDLLVALLLGLLGYAMIRSGYSRVMLVIGLVLGPLLEQNLLLSVNLYGWGGMLARPGVLLLLVLGALTLAWPVVADRRRARRAARATAAAPADDTLSTPSPPR